MGTLFSRSAATVLTRASARLVRRLGPPGALALAACGASPARCPEQAKAAAPSASASASPPAATDTGRPAAPISLDYDHAIALDWRNDGTADDRDGAMVRRGSFASPRGGRVPAIAVEPREPGKARAGVVFVHWGEGDCSELVADAVALAARGVVSLLLSGPTARPAALASPEVVTDREQYMQMVVDARRGLDWLLARGDVDPARLAFVGHSFGAHIGGVLAGVDPRPRAYVLMAGVASLVDFMQSSASPGIAGARASTPPAAWKRYLDSMAPLDARNFLPRAPHEASFLFQYAKDDAIVARDEGPKYRALAPGDARLLWYDGGHELVDPRAALDRRRWLLEHLGGAPAVAFAIEQRDLVAEGLAFDPGARALFVGSEFSGQILRLDERGEAHPFAKGLLAVLGLRVDGARRWLWAATNGEPGTQTDPARRGTSELVALDLGSGKPRARYVIRDGRPHLLNDVVLGPDGAAYVTDSLAGAVLRVRGGGPALEPFVAPGALAYPNGLTFANGSLYVATSAGLARVDAAGAVHPLASPEGVEARGVDGMYECHGDLLAIQNGMTPPRVVRFALAPGADRIALTTTLFVDDGTLPSPTTGAVDGSSLLLIARSDIDALTPSGLMPGDRPRTPIARLDAACR